MVWFRYGSLGKQIYQTAVLYHLIHGLALLTVGWLATLKPHDARGPATRHASPLKTPSCGGGR